MKHTIILLLLSFIFTGCYTTFVVEDDYRQKRNSSTIVYLDNGVSTIGYSNCYRQVNPYPYYYVNPPNCNTYYYSEYFYVGQKKYRTKTYKEPRKRVRSSGLSNYTNNRNRRTVVNGNRNREVNRTRSTRVQRTTRVERSNNNARSSSTRKNARKRDN